MRSAFEGILRDIRFALRGLQRTPVFTITILIAVTIGTGASTAVFSVVDRVLFRSLPYPHDSELVSVGMTAPITQQDFLLGSDYIEWRRHELPFAGFATMTGVNDCDLTGQPPLRTGCARVESTLLPALGVQPILGRNFTAEAARWTLFGIVLGAAGSLFAARLIRTLLFEVPANDYLGLGISLIGVFAVAILAAFIPSRRAALTDPLLALRQE